jgi:hypothetical protein
MSWNVGTGTALSAALVEVPSPKGSVELRPLKTKNITLEKNEYSTFIF